MNEPRFPLKRFTEDQELALTIALGVCDENRAEVLSHHQQDEQEAERRDNHYPDIHYL